MGKRTVAAASEIARSRSRAPTCAANERQFTTQLFYGLVTVKHYDRDETAKIGGLVKQCLADAGVKAANVGVLWIFHKDGNDTVDARWNGKEWTRLSTVS